MGAEINMVGKTFGKLTVIRKAFTDKRGEIKWLCNCECGNETVVLGSNLRTGNTVSCGCVVAENKIIFGQMNRRHGQSKDRIFRIWTGIRKRCNNPNTRSYSRYGGRGIKICERWNIFENFYEDMKTGYSDDLTIDRINVNGNYEPSNCRWATWTGQARNKTNNRLISIDGTIKTSTEWGEISGTNPATINYRVKKGWGTREAVFGKIKNMSDLSPYLCF